MARGKQLAILLEQTAHLVLKIAANADQTRTRHHQRSHHLALCALDSYLAIPAHAHQLGQTFRIVGITFIDPDRQCSTGVPSVDAHHRQVDALQLVPAGLGEGRQLRQPHLPSAGSALVKAGPLLRSPC
jgi:hypothetical protein